MIRWKLLENTSSIKTKTSNHKRKYGAKKMLWITIIRNQREDSKILVSMIRNWVLTPDLRLVRITRKKTRQKGEKTPNFLRIKTAIAQSIVLRINISCLMKSQLQKAQMERRIIKETKVKASQFPGKVVFQQWFLWLERICRFSGGSRVPRPMELLLECPL